MKALRIDSPGHASIVEVAEPDFGDGEVLLSVKIAGFCGTDLSTFRGVNPLVSYPRIPGHELACTIAAIGSRVPVQFSIGQDVLVHPYYSCGNCSACRCGRPNCCRYNQTLGVQREGGIVELLAVPWEKLYTSDSLSLTEMALVEPLTIGYHAVERARLEANEVTGVFGCGAIGIGAIAAAANRGATVIAIDVDDRKLALSKTIGAQHTVNSVQNELHGALQQLTGGEGPCVMIEAVGRPQTFRAAVEEVCFAGRVVYIGYSKQAVEYDTRHFVQRELDVLGSRNALPDDFRAVIRFLETNQFPIDKVVTQTVSLADAPEAMTAWDSDPGAVCKIHIQI